jgi:hypothetical protein
MPLASRSKGASTQITFLAPSSFLKAIVVYPFRKQLSPLALLNSFVSNSTKHMRLRALSVSSVATPEVQLVLNDELGSKLIMEKKSL